MNGMTIVDGEPIFYGVISEHDPMLGGAKVNRFGGELLLANTVSSKPKGDVSPDVVAISTFVRNERAERAEAGEQVHMPHGTTRLYLDRDTRRLVS